MDKDEALKILKKASNLEKGKEIALAKEFLSIENKIDDLSEELKKKEYITTELKGETGEQGIQGEQGIEGKQGEKGDKGDTTIVEKIIERTEVIRETPIVTNEIKEVALPIEAEIVVEEINALPINEERFKIDAKHIKNLPIYKGGELGGVVSRNLYQLDDAIISSPSVGDLLQWNGTKWINTPFDDNGILSLNGLTSATQTFATGTSGTDFNISSATSIHTFNLPTASATNRGALSSTDWSTFNNKLSVAVQSLNGLTGAVTLAAGTNITLTPVGNTITIAAIGDGTGTVTSVDMTVPTGLSISGNPITTSGTLALSLASGYVIPLQSTLDGYVKTDQTVGQTIGATGARLTKLWATDITVTNAISGSITGNASTVTTNANLTGVVTSVGNATSIADGALSIAKTSGLQSALDLKAPLASPTFTGTVVLPSTTSIGTVSDTEISYLDGVTSNIQAQFDAIEAGDVDSVNGLTGIVPLTGTTNRITISAANVFDIGTDVVTLTGSQALSNKTGLISQWTNNSGYLTANQTITLSGDVTGSGTTGITTTLATVNSNVGSFGSSTSIPTFTVNAKGLVTAVSGNAVIAPAGTLTGTTLASNVVTSSLTSVGTLAGLTVSGVLNLSGVNQMHQLSGHNFLQGDATNTYLYGGTSGLHFRSTDNSTALIDISNTGNLTFSTDNTQDIGASGATRPRTGYFGTSVVAPNFTGLASSATVLATPRAIYGNNFDGSAALTQVIASTYGGTGNGFTKFSGPTTSEKTFTLPNSSATLLYSGGALGTPSSGTGTNITGIPAANILAGSLGTGNFTVTGQLNVTTVINANTSGTVTSGFATGMTMGSWDMFGYPATGSNMVIGGYRSSQWDAIRFYASASEKMRVTTTGLGIGETAPAAALHVNSGGTSLQSIFNSTNADGGYQRFDKSGTTYGYIGNQDALTSLGGTGLALRSTGSIQMCTNGGTVRVVVDTAGAVRFNNYGAGTLVTDSAGNITASSDERLKDIQGQYSAGLQEILKINPIIYKWNEESKLETKDRYAGFSAQNVREALGGLSVGKTSDGHLTLQERAITAALVNAVKELQEQIKQLQEKLN